MARNIWLILTYTFFGPLVGAATFMLIAIGLDPILSAPGKSGFYDLVETWPWMLTLSYVLGLAPAFVSSIVQIVATRWLPTRGLRLTAAPIVGALTSTIVLGLFFLSEDFGIHSDWWVFTLLAITGGVAAFVSLSLVELFHPRPRLA